MSPTARRSSEKEWRLCYTSSLDARPQARFVRSITSQLTWVSQQTLRGLDLSRKVKGSSIGLGYHRNIEAGISATKLVRRNFERIICEFPNDGGRSAVLNPHQLHPRGRSSAVVSTRAGRNSAIIYGVVEPEMSTDAERSNYSVRGLRLGRLSRAPKYVRYECGGLRTKRHR
jgi:hypothetical protein